MSTESSVPDKVAEALRAAMESADLKSFADLLDPNVQWGPADDPASGCHNRGEVLAW